MVWDTLGRQKDWSEVMAHRLSRVLTVAGFVLSCFWTVPALAGPITVDWDVVPHQDKEIHFGDSKRYDCEGDEYSTRLCHSLWDHGLELSATGFSFYDDKWFDGYGVEYGGGGHIAAVCKPGLAPCFPSFTPLTLRIAGYSGGGPAPNLFIMSSRGGLMEIPSLNGLTSIHFAGSEWEDLVWLEFGFYLPDECYGDEPPEDDICNPETEKALVPEDLTFEHARSAPEPAVATLLAAGIASMGWRRATRGRRHS